MMKAVLTIAAVLVGLLEAQGAASSAPPAIQQAQHLSRPAPPPPPAIDDPQAGPFIVRLNDRGEIGGDQFGVIANAVRNWSGPMLQAFTICFRSHRESTDWTAALEALKTVSRALKAQGARIVVMPSGGVCAPSSPSPVWQDPHVEIMGVVSP